MSYEGSCFIGRLIVHPDFQNRGIGTGLMNKIERRFRDSARFELFTGHKSEGNIRLYRKLGYSIFKREPINDRLTRAISSFYSGCPVRKVLRLHAFSISSGEALQPLICSTTFLPFNLSRILYAAMIDEAPAPSARLWV